ncbi:MAG: YfhO family protein [Crocinitomicaceae bacterium]|nr:YfhO family protein [Crocinitomicaceae bacterium]
MSFNYKKILPHFIAIILFIVLASVYFSPIFNDYSLQQSDIKQFAGMEKEISDANMMNDEQALWTNSMFSGMPAYQISVKYPNNWIAKVDLILKLGLPRPIALLFTAMLGFYIFAMCLRVKPWIGILGAIAFGFSTINIIYIGAGHVTKVNSIAFMAPALGGLILAFRGRIILGSSIFALFLALNISANHLQMTYYLLFLLAAVALTESIRLVIEKKVKYLPKVVLSLLIATILAISPSVGNLSTTLEYSKYTTRGTTDLTIQPKGKKELKVQAGLDKNYILEYNYGKGELLSIIAPNAKGEKAEYLGNDEDVMLNVDAQYKDNIGQMNRYWGGQRMCGGAFYFGVFMLIFALFGLIFSKDLLKWPFLLISILALLLASNDPGGMNDFFITKIPLYNKFRDSKMILVLLQVIIPAMAVLFLDKLFKKEITVKNKKIWLYSSVGMVVLFIILYAAPSISGAFLSNAETAQFNQAIVKSKNPDEISFINGLKSELMNVRVGIYQSDMGRAIFLVILACGLILMAVYTKISALLLAVIGIVFVTADNMSVSKRYLNNEDIDGNNMSWQDVTKGATPYFPEKADYSILEREQKQIPTFNAKASQLANKMEALPKYEFMESRNRFEIAQFGALNLNSHYKVLSFENPFNETGTSYFHKSIGGYHGAKLKRYQEIIEFHLNQELQAVNSIIGAAKNEKLREYATKMTITQDQMQAVFDTISVDQIALTDNTPVLNMLNTKYIILNRGLKAIQNSNTNGPVWFVKSIKKVSNSNQEMLGLTNLKTKDVAIVNTAESGQDLKNEYSVDSTAQIKLVKYGTNSLKYSVSTTKDVPAIFSEIYYPEGWNCYADGKELKPFRANYVLRGAIIPAGTQTVEWKFEPQSFYTASKIALIGSILLILSIIFVLGKTLMASFKEENIPVLEN